MVKPENNITPDNNINIVILGSGNVASHMAKALDAVAHVSQIYSPNIDHASRLASQLSDAAPINDLSELNRSAQFYIVSVNDDAVAEVAKNAPSTAPGSIWAHTSGSVPADVFKPFRKDYGVFYPLQTFNRLTDVDFSEVPMLIEGNSQETADNLFRLASGISKNVRFAGSADRKLFHLSAVFACNFTNRMWAIADEILHTGGYDITLLEPLLKMTLRNALASAPKDVQTGPARRHDDKVINAHLSALPESYAKIYKLISENISSAYPHEQN